MTAMREGAVTVCHVGYGSTPCYDMMCMMFNDAQGAQET